MSEKMSRKKAPVKPSPESTCGVAQLDKESDVLLDSSVVDRTVPVPSTGISKKSERKSKMSKIENAPEKSEVKKLSKKVKYIDFKTFEQKEQTIEAEFTPAVSFEEGVKRLGNDEKALVGAINSILESRTLQAKKKEVLGDAALNKKVVLDFIKPFRMSMPFSGMVTTEKGKDPNWKSQYNNQTTALLKQVASNEFMLAAIKSAAENATDEEGEDEE